MAVVGSRKRSRDLRAHVNGEMAAGVRGVLVRSWILWGGDASAQWAGASDEWGVVVTTEETRRARRVLCICRLLSLEPGNASWVLTDIFCTRPQKNIFGTSTRTADRTVFLLMQ